MDENIVVLIDKKLNKALKKVDERINAYILKEWEKISAAPSCSTISDVMKNIISLVYPPP